MQRFSRIILFHRLAWRIGVSSARSLGGKAVLIIGFAMAALNSPTHAEDVKITIQSMSSAGSVALSPFSLAVHDGSFDAFDAGGMALNGVEEVAELGDGTNWMAAASTADPAAVTGLLKATNNGFGPGIFLPGGSGSLTLSLDPAENRYLSYGAMVVPSNDAFLGNDSPTSVELFDGNGDFVGQTVTIPGSQIWDAGTEVNQLLGAAYLDGQTATDGTDENGTVLTVDIATEFDPYLTNVVASGGTFDTLPVAAEPLATISFEVVPEPTSAGLAFSALLALGLFARRRR